MATTIQETCGRILQTVRTSNLNYSCQETHYSIYLTVRKSLSKHQQGLEAIQQLYQPDGQTHLLSLQSELADLNARLKASDDRNKDLKSKAAAEVINHHVKLNDVLNKKDDEIKLLKASIKSSASEAERVNSEIRDFKKTLKSKEIKYTSWKI